MKNREMLKWAVLAAAAVIFAYLGRINFQHRFTGIFPLLVLGAVAAILFIYYFLDRRTS
jgi:hypothetical protein